MNVLVIDDDLVNLKVVCKYLKELDLELFKAENGQEGWDIMQECDPAIDIVLTDRMMPIMDGIELTKKIKKDERFKDVLVIMLTAAVEAQQILEGNAVGVYYYITKPFDKEKLISIVTDAIEEIKQPGDSSASSSGEEGGGENISNEGGEPEDSSEPSEGGESNAMGNP